MGFFFKSSEEKELKQRKKDEIIEVEPVIWDMPLLISALSSRTLW